MEDIVVLALLEAKDLMVDSELAAEPRKICFLMFVTPEEEVE